MFNVLFKNGNITENSFLKNYKLKSCRRCANSFKNTLLFAGHPNSFTEIKKNFFSSSRFRKRSLLVEEPVFTLNLQNRIDIANSELNLQPIGISAYEALTK